MNWEYEEIEALNAPEADQSRSKLDHLLRIGAAAPETLCELANAIEASGPDFVGTLFQIPYPISIERQWLTLPTSPDSIRAEVKFSAGKLQMDDFGRFELLPDRRHDFDERQGLEITQGIALFRVWGKRQRAHRRYLSVLEHQGRWDSVVAPQAESWIGNRPITATAYEENFGRRLRAEVEILLRNFLPAYSLASRSEAPPSRWVYGFVPMLAPGRLANMPALPIAKHYFTGTPKEETPLVTPTELDRALKNPYRVIGRFETQLFAMERLRREGEVALSLIGTTALLEWLLKATVVQLGGSKANLQKLLIAPELQFIPRELLMKFEAVRNTRNEFAHGKPPARRSGILEHSEAYAGREIDFDRQISSKDMRDLIDVAFEIFRIVNARQSGRPSTSHR